MARVVAEGVPHHITQRGNNRQNVFLLDEDRRFYLETLKAKCREHGVAVLGYCLMTNHVHLVAIPRHPDSLARALGQADGQYAAWFNKRHQRSGHLWQNRYYSCPLGGSYLVTAPAYVDLNPLRAGMARNALEYAWSSAKAHAVGVETDSLVDEWAWSELKIARNWNEILEAESDNKRSDELRRATHSGLPLGDAAFVAEMERRAERKLRPGRPGRRPNAARAAAAAVISGAGTQLRK